MSHGKVHAPRTVGRRGLLRLGALLAAVPVAGAVAAPLPADAPVLYLITSPDCPPCRVWESEFGGAFEKSAEWARLRLVPMPMPTVRDSIYQNWVWPKDVRWVRDELARQKYPSAMPMFVLVHKGRVVAVETGIEPKLPYGWRADFLAAVRKETGLDGGTGK